MRAVVSLVARYRSPTTFEYANETCADVSVGGMFIQSAVPAPAGTLLKLECETDLRDDAKIRGVARVVWQRRETNENGPSGMGVKFVKLEPGSRELIENIVQRLADAGVQARSVSDAPEHRLAMAAGAATSTSTSAARAVQLVDSSTPATSDAQAADRWSPSIEAPPPATRPVATAAQTASIASDTDSGERPSLRPNGSVEAEPAKSGRSGLRFWIIAAVLVLIAIAIADRRGFGPRSSEVTPEPEATPQPQVAEPTPAPQAAPAEAPAAAPEAPQAAVAEPTPTTPEPEATKPQETKPEEAKPEEAKAEPEKAEPAAAAGSEPLFPLTGNQVPYIVDFVSRPNEASLLVDDKVTITTPQTVNIGAMPKKIRVTAKKKGYQSSSIWLEREDFEKKDGALRRRVYITLKSETEAP